jgi:hypothetical protein
MATLGFLVIDYYYFVRFVTPLLGIREKGRTPGTPAQLTTKATKAHEGKGQEAFVILRACPGFGAQSRSIP